MVDVAAMEYRDLLREELERNDLADGQQIFTALWNEDAVLAELRDFPVALIRNSKDERALLAHIF